MSEGEDRIFLLEVRNSLKTSKKKRD
jgi:hypothetical protein